MNRVHLLGRLGQDPEIAVTKAGRSVANFSLATTFGHGDKRRTEWHRIVCYGRTAEIAGQYLDKGAQVALTGYLHTETYTGNDNVRRTLTKVVVNELYLLSNRSSKSQDDPFASTPPATVSDDDLPF